MSLGESVMKPNAMMWRNLASMDVEESIRANPIDAVVLLASCDKTTPSVLMGAASADLPTILVTGGPQVSGWHRGRFLGSGAKFDLGDSVRAGELSVEEFHEIEDGICRSVCHCMDMGSAATIACCSEAMGITLPGCATVPAVDSRRAVLAERSGRRAVELALEGVRFGDIVTRPAMENAIRVLSAIGGSTNAVVHLLAIAGRLGHGITLDDFDRAKDTPLLVNVLPSGKYLFDEFWRAGGMPALLGELLPILHGDCLTVNGRTLAENVSGRRSENHEWIRPLHDPIQDRGGITVLRGSLAPDSAVIKGSAASPHLLRHRGPAYVFENVEHLAERIGDPELPVTADTVLVLRNGGPKGAPGFPEYGHISMPERLLRAGVRDAVRISDSRMGGTSSGTVVLHVSPEAVLPGPLAVIRTGDPCPSTSRPAASSSSFRQASWSAGSPRGSRRRRNTSAATGSSSSSTSSGHEGADFDFLQNPDGARPDLIPLGTLGGWVGFG